MTNLLLDDGQGNPLSFFGHRQGVKKPRTVHDPGRTQASDLRRTSKLWPGPHGLKVTDYKRPITNRLNMNPVCGRWDSAWRGLRSVPRQAKGPEWVTPGPSSK